LKRLGIPKLRERLKRWFLVVGLRFIVYGLRLLKTKNPFRNFGTKNLKPQTINLKPETINLKPETINLKLETKNSKP